MVSLRRDFNVVGKNGKESNMILRCQGWVIHAVENQEKKVI